MIIWWNRYEIPGLGDYAGMTVGHITRPAIAERHLSLMSSDKVRYQLKTLYRDGIAHVIFELLDFVTSAPLNTDVQCRD